MDVDVTHVDSIPDTCDLVYQTYGVRYGIESSRLSAMLDRGESPIVIINDIRVVEEIREAFTGRVLSLFLFRKIPELIDFQIEAENRGNMSETEINARYEKAVAIYRIYIENIALFDKVILNSVEYAPGEERGADTILDRQLENILAPIVRGHVNLRKNISYPKLSRIFVIAGNAASGKDEIIRALLTMGKLQAKVLPKYTMRQQEREDGEEIICRLVPQKACLEKLRHDYVRQQEEMEAVLGSIPKPFRSGYRKEVVEFERQLGKSLKDEYARFWQMISEQLDKDHMPLDKVQEKYFTMNPAYLDLAAIESSHKKTLEMRGVRLYEDVDRKYLIYGTPGKLYGCDISNVARMLEENRRHLVIVASEIGVVNILKKLYGEDRVRLIYAHSEISEQEFEKNASDISKAEKKKKFREILDNYTEEISNFDHVTIYARSRLTYMQTSKEEELVDQMFRLLRAY